MDAITTTTTIAPLANVSLCLQALDTAIDRPDHLPGITCFYGPSGYGKSFSAAFAANKRRAYHIECRSSWTKKALLEAILKEMGIFGGKTIYQMTDDVAEQLIKSRRPLIVDEVDHIVDKSAIEIIRDIYEGSGAPILLIGEEKLPAKLKRWERFHGRVLDWCPAQPAGIKDAKHLAKLYSPDVEIDEDLLIRITEIAKGSVRRICVNLERIRTLANQAGMDAMNLSMWGNRELFSGDAPIRRVG